MNKSERAAGPVFVFADLGGGLGNQNPTVCFLLVQMYVAPAFSSLLGAVFELWAPLGRAGAAVGPLA